MYRIQSIVHAQSTREHCHCHIHSLPCDSLKIERKSLSWVKNMFRCTMGKLQHPTSRFTQRYCAWLQLKSCVSRMNAGSCCQRQTDSNFVMPQAYFLSRIFPDTCLKQAVPFHHSIILASQPNNQLDKLAELSNKCPSGSKNVKFK